LKIWYVYELVDPTNNDEQAAYRCESDRICELLDSGYLTNISIATTPARKKAEPVFTVKECVSFLKGAGWVIAYPPNKYDYVIPIASQTMPDNFSTEIHETAKDMLSLLYKWSKLGKVVPSEIISRNIRLDLGGLNG